MEIKLYRYQEIALEKVLYALRRFGRALMVMATGLGKTIVSSKLVELFLSDNPGKRILFLSHDNGILEQSLLKYESILGNRYSYARFFGVKKDWNADKYDIVFATFQSSPHKLFNADHFDFIIVDESHHSKADTYFECLQYFRPKWKLGMTATPDREDEQDIRSIFGKEVVNDDLPSALANGWLTPVEYQVLTDGLDRETLEEICNEVLVENIRITEGQLNERIFIRTRSEEQCKKIIEYTCNNLKAIVFCRNISHLEHIYEILPNSVIVHSERSEEQNKEAERMYVSGKASHILVVDKYNEGKDLPDTDILVFMRGTESYRIWAQQLGRGLRLFPGKEKVIVLDFVANIERIKNIDKLIRQIGKFGKNGQSNDMMKINSPLHIEGANFIFDFTSEIVNIFSVLERIMMPFYATWQEASLAAIRLGITSSEDYRLKCSLDSRLYVDPQSRYKDFPGWYIFLGKIKFPENWLTRSSYANKNLVDSVVLSKEIEKIKEEFPDEFGLFYSNNGSLTEFFSPKVIKVLDSLIPSKKLIKTCKTKNQIINELKSINVIVGNRTISTFLNKYKVSNPHWFIPKNSYTKNLLLHPELCDKAITYFSVYAKPKGWLTSNQIAILKNRSRVSVEKSLDLLANDNVFFVKLAYGENGFLNYYNPLLLESILESNPEGWLTLDAIVTKKIDGLSTPMIKKYVESFREENPEFFKVFSSSRGQSEYIHPSLIKKIYSFSTKKKFVLSKKVKKMP
jgi:superfamily II DNA or RNA helicase